MKTKNFFLTLLLTAMIFVPAHLGAQVTIGGTNVPNEFSILELMSNDTRGLRLPQLTTQQRNDMQDEFGALAQTEAKGLQIFNTDTRCVETWNGTHWIPSCFCPRGSVEINGVCWATRNVDAPDTFTRNPQDFGMFYQWNRRVGWSVTDPLEGTDGSTTWNTTNPEGTEWYAVNDPCPSGWRVPTPEELILLHNAMGEWTADWNDTGVGGRVFGTYPNQIFLPGVNHRRSTGLFDESFQAAYWGNRPEGENRGWRLFFAEISSNVAGVGNRASGFSIRCVVDF